MADASRGFDEHYYSRGFDEHYYLAANPDVAQAVKRGIFASGAEHFEKHGARERRSARADARIAPPPLPIPGDLTGFNRRDKLLAGLDLTALDGAEIGALAFPLVRPAEGNITYVDWTDTQTLRRNYANDPAVNVDEIVDVGAIWGSNTLLEALGGRKIDYVINSHVVEHVPDLVTWLAEIREVLRPGGRLRMIAPDRRFTFDILRNETRLHDVLDAWIRKARAPLPRALLENLSLLREFDFRKVWEGDFDPLSLPAINDTKRAIADARDVLENNKYIDNHCWVFTPKSMATLFAQLAEIDLLNFRLSQFFDTPYMGAEFTVHMAPCDNKDEIIASWREMAALAADLPPPRRKRIARLFGAGR